MIELLFATREEIKGMQQRVIESHYLHKPIDQRCSIEAYRVLLNGDDIGLLMFGRPEATRCGKWYGSVDSVNSGLCEVTRWQVLNLARVWLSPRVQPGGDLYSSSLLPGFTDRRGNWRSTLASSAIKMAAQRIGYEYVLKRPPCFLDEPYHIKYLMSYCDKKVHRGVIYKEAGFELFRTNEKQIETWRLPLPPLTSCQDDSIQAASETNERSRKYRSDRLSKKAQLSLLVEEG